MACTTDDIKNLFAEFPQEDIHWRAQTVTKDGTKAMALAYLDARDVMDRLDQVCGADNWQDSYTETASGRVICTISIRVGDEWISKSDGAGSTGMEGEKGGISDAFKRAAVKWGVGRYLYDMPAPWVPCECGEWNGKKQWRRWTANPWDFVNKPKQAANTPKKDARELYSQLDANMRENQTRQDLIAWWQDPECRDLRMKLPSDWQKNLRDEWEAMGKALATADTMAAG